MGKKIFSLCMALALCLGLLPVTALAAPPGDQVIYVGNENVTSGGYWTTDSAGTVTAFTGEGSPADTFIHYDAENNVLTLHNATIKNELEFNESIEGGTFISGSAIGVFNKSGNAELTISLVGTNTIANVGKGIFVLASSASTGSSNLTIQGDGSLNASASQTGIWVQSNGNNAALCVENAEVTASADGAVKNGVLVQAKDGSDVSLTVNGGSLTASVNANIWFQFGSGISGSGTPTVTVSNNAIVRANGGIANTSSTSIQYGTGSDSTGGIVFDGNTGTVYGAVTLQEDLEIGEGESLTIPEGSSLDMGGNEITVASGGKLDGTPTGGAVVYGPTITKQPEAQSVIVGQTATFTITANGSEPLSYQWQKSDSSDNWADISGAISTIYTTEATTTGMNGYQYRCVVSNSAGSVTSDAATLTVNAPTTYTISTDIDPVEAGTVTVNGNGTSATVTAGDEVTLAATANSGYRFVGWMEGDQTVSTDTTYAFQASSNRSLTAKFEKVYTVTVNVSGNGTATADKTTAAEGETVTLTATPDSSYRFTGWTSSDGVTFANASSESTTFTMPAGDVTVTAGFTRISSGSTTYAITAPDAENGTVRVSPSRASRGTTVTITVTPDEGYELESLTVLDSRDNEITLTDKGDGKYTFTMPAGRVTVEASFAEIAPEPLPFGDMDDGDWFADAVRFVYENGMMNGVSETDFAPHATTSRSMIVTILYRLEGEPVVDYAMGFTDVAGDAYYAEAVRWAASEGIVGGYGGGLFGAEDAVTREQLAVILYRYAVYKGYDVSIGEDTNILSYDDFADLSEYAIPAMQWACGAGIVNGTSESTLTPQGEATRAQVAAMLMRFCEAIG